MYANMFRESAISDFVELGKDKQVNFMEIKGNSIKIYT